MATSSRYVCMTHFCRVLHFSSLELDAEDIKMRNGLYNVGRKVGLDDTLTTKTANASLGFIPIGAIQDERDEFPFLERRNKFERSRLVTISAFS